MWKTVLFLIFTLIIVPYVAFKFDDPISTLQKATLIKVFAIYFATAIACFIVSTMTQNYSQVDKLWSIMPVIYGWVIYFDNTNDSRILLMAILISIWGIRLTYNFGRRGGYKLKFWQGDEDYRWSILRAKPEFNPKWKWVLFNFFFISLYQMGLIFLITLPMLKCMDGSPLHFMDFILAIIFVLFVYLEWLADQQQWDYQNKKHQLLKENKNLPQPYQKGFVHTGLWAIVRHPNYAAEQAIWVVIYLFTIPAMGHWINWSIAGCLLLIILFKGSSDFSEEISAAKYPAYAEYQNKVPRFFPFVK